MPHIPYSAFSGRLLFISSGSPLFILNMMEIRRIKDCQKEIPY